MSTAPRLRIVDFDASQTAAATSGLDHVVPSQVLNSPAPATGSADGNVVVLPLAHRTMPHPAIAPALSTDPAHRLVIPAHAPPSRGWVRRALIVLSLCFHAALIMTFAFAARDVASLDVRVISVELVPGALKPAGRSAETSPHDVASAPSQPSRTVPDAARPAEPQPQASLPPDDSAVSTPVTARDPAPSDPSSEAHVSAASPSSPEAALPAEDQATQPAPPVQAAARPNAAPATTKPTKRIAQPTHARRQTDDTPRTLAPPAAPSPGLSASRSSNGAGVGRSDNLANYRGLVAAHLARFKRIPSEARGNGQTGTAMVAFAVSGSGSVTATRLVRSSGEPSIDREALAMVQRASPLPPPPDGSARQMTVPVHFSLR